MVEEIDEESDYVKGVYGDREVKVLGGGMGWGELEGGMVKMFVEMIGGGEVVEMGS